VSWGKKRRKKIICLVRDINMAFFAWQRREQALQYLLRAQHLKARLRMKL